MEKQFHHKSNDYANRMVFTALIEISKTDPDSFLLLAKLLRIALEQSPKPAGEKIWMKDESSLLEFFSALKEKGRLEKDEDWENFKDVMLGKSATWKQIKWNGNINEMVYLIERLTDEGVILRHATPYTRLQRIFLNKFGKQLNNRSLSVLVDKGVANKENEKMLDKVVEHVLKNMEMKQ